MTDKGMGAVNAIDENGVLAGLLTDGDVRRGLKNGTEFLNRPVQDVMTVSPKVITADRLAAEALHVMEKHSPPSHYSSSCSG